jgi:tRNA(Arg) A34 adenosine deaminase TadA
VKIIEEIMEHPSLDIMKRAIEFGYKDGTVGCVIVKGNEIVTISGGTIFTDEYDVTGHSEINAIRKACKILKTSNLSDCWIYSTYEPCPMCMSAICWAKMKGVVYAASQSDCNERWTCDVQIKAKEIILKANHKPILIEEYCREESLKILSL